MLYKNFKGLQLSALGMGTVRLPITSENSADIDIAEVDKMIDAAMEKGINYYDLAWDYHDYRAEPVVGQSLQRYPRENYYIATKFPGFNTETMEKKEEIFEEQLKKLQMDYVDFYLFHCLSDASVEWYLDPKYGLMDYMLEQKAKGRIKHIGVSVHASLETLTRFLDAYGKHIEFCQLQLNWLDWDYQDAKAKVNLLNERNIPVWVMEPLRGGKLASFYEQHQAILNQFNPNYSAVEWSFRHLQSIPGVSVVLSGMSNMDQLSENIRIFETEQPLNEQEIRALYTIANDLVHTVPCTACRYCTPACPNEIDIPEMIKIYNEQIFARGEISASKLQDVPQEKQPAACIGCGACEALCPQNIKISEVMKDFVSKTKE